MKRKIILPILLVAAVLGVVLASSGIGRNADAGNKHILVAFFSATGNTKSVAETAATALNADLFRIVPVEAYTEADLGYGADARVHREQSDPSSRPGIKNTVENWDQYDTILIGYPIWSGVAPKIINTFADSYDFTGKAVAFFCTSGSSGVEDSENALKGEFAGANFLPGTRFETGASVMDIQAWADLAGIR